MPDMDQYRVTVATRTSRANRDGTVSRYEFAAGVVTPADAAEDAVLRDMVAQGRAQVAAANEPNAAPAVETKPTPKTSKPTAKNITKE